MSDTEATTKSVKEGGLRTVVDRHLGLAVSAGTVVAFSIHLLAVSHGSAETAVALIGNGGPANVLLPVIATSFTQALASALAVIGPSVLCDPRTRPGWAEPL